MVKLVKSLILFILCFKSISCRQKKNNIDFSDLEKLQQTTLSNKVSIVYSRERNPKTTTSYIYSDSPNKIVYFYIKEAIIHYANGNGYQTLDVSNVKAWDVRLLTDNVYFYPLFENKSGNYDPIIFIYDYANNRFKKLNIFEQDL